MSLKNKPKAVILTQWCRRIIFYISLSIKLVLKAAWLKLSLVSSFSGTFGTNILPILGRFERRMRNNFTPPPPPSRTLLRLRRAWVLNLLSRSLHRTWTRLHQPSSGDGDTVVGDIEGVREREQWREKGVERELKFQFFVLFWADTFLFNFLVLNFVT